jgi:predicted 2-oxoglutarate/Fe(II)-dependent dioxygenase YbiX
MFIGHFDLSQPLLWTIRDVLSHAECAEILADASRREWLAATVNAAEGRVVREHIRNNTLAILPDPELAKRLFERARPKVPEVLAQRQLFGIREPLRIYRYEAGQHFGIHSDQAYDGPEGTSSLLTFMVYLNDDFDGGATDFPEQRETIRPRTGMALLFQHMVLHEGCRVTRGSKFVIRSDILYRPAA